jgi:3,4-dihydroxy 2-butanone 4-phosphate synthase/GTP cyclohydrolase II
MARRPDLEKFAEHHGLKIGTIADLIEYRLRNEPTVERVAECRMPTEFGEFRLVAYRDTIERCLHLALVRGEVRAEVPVPVRVHMQNTLCDLFANRRSDCGWPLRDALRYMAEHDAGVAVILRQTETADGLLRHIQDYGLEDHGINPPRQEPTADLRTYGIGAQILKDLGVRRMRVMSSPKRMHGLSGFDLEVVDYIHGDE